MVQIANEDQIFSEGRMNCLTFSIQHVKFTTKAYILPLASCDLVSGVIWLQTLGTIQCNFKELTIKFELDKQEVLQRGLVNSRLVGVGGIPKPNGGNNKSLLLHLMEIEQYNINIPFPLLKLLQKFSNVFEEPQGLPPSRVQNHAYLYYLEPNSYQYPNWQYLFDNRYPY